MRERDVEGAGPWGPPGWASGPWSSRAPRPLRVLGPLILMVVQVGGTFGAARGQPSRRMVDVFAVLLLVLGPTAIWFVRRSPRVARAAIVAATAVTCWPAIPTVRSSPVSASPWSSR